MYKVKPVCLVYDNQTCYLFNTDISIIHPVCYILMLLTFYIMIMHLRPLCPRPPPDMAF